MELEKVKEFIRLADIAKEIINNEFLEWKEKYDLIFGLKIQSTTGITFDWYDPDTTYEEDVTYYFEALMEKADRLRTLTISTTNRTCLDCKHFTYDWDWEDGMSVRCEGKDVWAAWRDDTESFRQKMKTAINCDFYDEAESY